MQIYLRGLPGAPPSVAFDILRGETASSLHAGVAARYGLPGDSFYLTCSSRCLCENVMVSSEALNGRAIHVNLRMRGGIDFQHREGSKIGSGGNLSEAQAALGRRDRLRKLALETIDLQKDPYFMRNHLGSYECKLCLTLHPNEGNYLAHTQGKRHQSNLGRRAAMEAKAAAPAPSSSSLDVKKRKTIKIGRPAYKVTKSKDLETQQRSLTFEIDFLEADENVQPRHRFMSAYEQKVEVPDKNYQFILFACDPYDTIAFKIPNQPIDKSEGRFFSSWDAQSRKFVLSLQFL